MNAKKTEAKAHAPASPAKGTHGGAASGSTKPAAHKVTAAAAPTAKMAPRPAGKPTAKLVAKPVARPVAKPATATGKPGAKAGKGKPVGPNKGVDPELAEIEAEIEGEPVVVAAGAVEPKAKPLRMKVSRAKERALMREFGLDEHITTAQGDFSESGGYNGAGELLALDPRPTAIFAANDLSAAGALGRVEDAGLEVPLDVAIVGYDNTGLAAMHHLSLTTINQPRREFGRIATQLIFERLDEGRTIAVHHVVAPTLVVRRTSGPRGFIPADGEVES
jgi:ABC-type sugar transport system substrate-binding protein